jgi:pyridoxamine 5'-phosphate oxidase
MVLLKLSKQLEGKSILRPANWGGYRLESEMIEFWQGRLNRLHDRLRFIKQESGEWQIKRPAP